MGHASIKTKLQDSCMSENGGGPGSDDKRRRAERRWKRWERSSNNSLKRNRCAGATRINVTSNGNTSVLTSNGGHIVEDELDEEYKNYLDTCVSNIDVDRDSNVDGYDFDLYTGYNSDDDGDDVDPQYKLFLGNLRAEGNSYVSSFVVGNQLVHTRYEEEELRYEEEVEETGNPMESQQSLETESIPCNKRPRSDVSSVPKINCNIQLESHTVDEDYQTFLNSHTVAETGNPMEYQQSVETERGPCNRRPRSDVSSVHKINCNIQLESDTVDEDYQTFLNSHTVDDENLAYVGAGDLGTMGSDSIRKQTDGQLVESQQTQVTERGPCNTRPCSEVSSMPKNSCNTELVSDAVDEDYQFFLNSYGIDGECLVYLGTELREKSSNDIQNLQISDLAVDTPDMQWDVDEDYQLFLNSGGIVDGDLVYMHDRNNIKKYNVDSTSNSSDSDVIVLEPYQICENTPFVCSKTYDSSWFEDGINTRDSTQVPASGHSAFRKKLMEYLERPYDQEEYDRDLHEVYRQTNKDRHFETRQGVIKSYPAYGVNKSYLELYPDFAKVFAEFKETKRVLFLLRGFVFWLEHAAEDGIFRPWLDESCLDILRKM